MKELTVALLAAQKEMPAVEKTAKANYGMYATLDHLIAKTRPVLNKHGLAVVQFPAVSDLGQPLLRTILVHGATGQMLEADMPLLLPDDKKGMQALGAAITYARRYALSAALGIAAEDDDDGASATSAKAETNGQPKVISEAQRKRLYAMSKEAAMSDDELKALVLRVARVESSKDIPVARYDELCAQVEASSVPF